MKNGGLVGGSWELGIDYSGFRIQNSGLRIGDLAGSFLNQPFPELVEGRLNLGIKNKIEEWGIGSWELTPEVSG